MYENLSRAIDFACTAHYGQHRKHSNLPYIIHPLDVMQTLISCGFDHEDLLVAAVLHDVVEDCGIHLIDIQMKFGYRVACIVRDVTKSPQTYHGANRTEKWEFYIKYLQYSSALVKSLKLADRNCNLKDYHRDWDLLEKDTKDFVKRVYVKEAGDLIKVCNNEEKSDPFRELIILLANQIRILLQR